MKRYQNINHQNSYSQNKTFHPGNINKKLFKKSGKILKEKLRQFTFYKIRN